MNFRSLHILVFVLVSASIALVLYEDMKTPRPPRYNGEDIEFARKVQQDLLTAPVGSFILTEDGVLLIGSRRGPRMFDLYTLTGESVGSWHWSPIWDDSPRSHLNILKMGIHQVIIPDDSEYPDYRSYFERAFGYTP